MAMGDQYRVKAAQLGEKAKSEPNVLLRAEYTTLAVSYLRLAEQADRNDLTDVFDETPRQQPQAQQQQQTQEQQPDQPKPNEE